MEQSGDHEAGEAGHQDRFEDQQILGEGKGQEHRRDRRAGTACNEGAHACENIGGGHMAGEGLNARTTGQANGPSQRQHRHEQSPWRS